MSATLLTRLGCFIMAAVCVIGYSDAMHSHVKYPAVRVMADETAVVPCWDLHSPSELKMWITPQDNIVAAEDFFLRSSRYRIDVNGSLVVEGTTKKDSGRYSCIVKPENEEYFMAYSEVDVIDVSYIPELDDIQANLTRGLVAAACTAVFFIVACGVGHHSWEAKEEKKHERRIGLDRPDIRETAPTLTMLSSTSSPSCATTQQEPKQSISSSDESTIDDAKQASNKNEDLLKAELKAEIQSETVLELQQQSESSSEEEEPKENVKTELVVAGEKVPMKGFDNPALSIDNDEIDTGL